MRRSSIPSALLATVVLAPLASAQLCMPLPPAGQAALVPITPVCVGVIPPPPPGCGGLPCPPNPGFAMSAFAPPPLAPGLPMALVLTIPVFPPPPPFPPGILDPTFGPGGLAGIYVSAVPAGITGPVPGPPIPIPIPPGLPPGPPLLAAHTAALTPFPAVALTGAVGVGWP